MGILSRIPSLSQPPQPAMPPPQPTDAQQMESQIDSMYGYQTPEQKASDDSFMAKFVKYLLQLKKAQMDRYQVQQRQVI
jgi:hypothetical protein